jgi:ABC-type uncharacterized transport system fused permease/ATPase subunit
MATLRTVGKTFADVPNRKRLTAALLLLTLAVSATGIVFNFLSKDFWDALSEKDVLKFRQLVLKFLVALLVGTPLIGLHEYVKVSSFVQDVHTIMVLLIAAIMYTVCSLSCVLPLALLLCRIKSTWLEGESLLAAYCAAT